MLESHQCVSIFTRRPLRIFSLTSVFVRSQITNSTGVSCAKSDHSPPGDAGQP